MRVEFTIEEPFKIFPMTELLIIPNAGDNIDLEDFINENSCSDETYKKLCNRTWRIKSRRWSKDEKGIYVQLWCRGE